MKTSKPQVGKTVKRPANPLHQPDSANATLKIPPILLEGDEPGWPPVTERRQKYSLDATPTVERQGSKPRELPEAYGTARLLFLARDPHSLYAHWDLTSAQQRHYNSLAADGHLVLRVHQEDQAGPNTFELHVFPASQHWFVPVPAGGATYLAEIGYYSITREWTSVAVSRRVSTPPETVSQDKSAHFATMPAGVSWPQSSERLEITPAQALPAESHPTLLPPPRVSWLPGLGVEPSDAANQGSVSVPDWTYDPRQSDLPASMSLLSEAWTLEQERALNEILGFGMVSEDVISSLQLARASA